MKQTRLSNKLRISLSTRTCLKWPLQLGSINQPSQLKRRATLSKFSQSRFKIQREKVALQAPMEQMLHLLRLWHLLLPKMLRLVLRDLKTRLQCVIGKLVSETHKLGSKASKWISETLEQRARRPRTKLRTKGLLRLNSILPGKATLIRGNRLSNWDSWEKELMQRESDWALMIWLH